jgi:hypothetical protein
MVGDLIMKSDPNFIGCSEKNRLVLSEAPESSVAI